MELESQTKLGRRYEIITKVSLAGLALLVGGMFVYSSVNQIIKEGPKKAYESFCNGAYAANASVMIHYNPPYPAHLNKGINK